IEDAQWRLSKAEKMSNAVLGRNRDYHAFNAKVRMALRKAAVAGAPASLPLASDQTPNTKHQTPDSEEGGEAAYMSPSKTPAYQESRKLVMGRARRVWRDLFRFKAVKPVALEDVQQPVDLVRNHFRGAAMSHGALTKESHQDICAAFNDLGGRSNSGEGGEAR